MAAPIRKPSGIIALCLALAASSAALASGAIPDASTPGAIDPAVTQANIRQTICVPGYSRTVWPPSWYTSKMKHRQLAAEGIGRIRDFEEDHVIPLSVGGNPRDGRNLWPEPRFGVWNAEKKDQLEGVMHRKVCDGSISLRAAQDAFRGNWTVAYRRYVLPSSLLIGGTGRSGK
jgi:hypothetical protein